MSEHLSFIYTPFDLKGDLKDADHPCGTDVRYRTGDFLLACSSMVEHPAVNRRVAGSSPAVPARSL